MTELHLCITSRGHTFVLMTALKLLHLLQVHVLLTHHLLLQLKQAPGIQLGRLLRLLTRFLLLTRPAAAGATKQGIPAC